MSNGPPKKVESIWGARTLSFIFILMAFAVIPGVAAQQYVHLDYDWEGDDVSVEGHPAEEFEACPACHGAEHTATPKICEDCHLPNGPGPHLTGGEFSLRPDYSAPLVYEHYYRAEDIWTKNQSRGLGMSTCFSVNPVVGGACHGISYAFMDSAGGHFAFNWNWTGELRGRDVYEYTAPASSLPDTSDCLFCHNQRDEQIRSIWGDATQINSSHSKMTNSECYECHVEGKTAPASFHSRGLYVVLEGSDEGEVKTPGNTFRVGVIVLVLALISYLLLVRRPGKK